MADGANAILAAAAAEEGYYFGASIDEERDDDWLSTPTAASCRRTKRIEATEKTAKRNLMDTTDGNRVGRLKAAAAMTGDEDRGDD